MPRLAAGGALVATLLAGCAGAIRRVDAEACVPHRLTRLYFGSRMPDGTHVDDRQWLRFVEDHVVPAAPGGFTVLRGHGGWRDATGMQHETARVLEVVHADGNTAKEAWRGVAQAYAKRFRQQSVLRTRHVVDVCG